MTLALTLTLVIVIIVLHSSSLNSSINSNLNVDDDENKRHCDWEVCDSLVNKCFNRDKCSCDFKKDIQCAKECIDCLEEKFGKCCGCVNLCPAIKDDKHSSHVGNTSHSDQQFFEVLTETDDIHGRWSIETTQMSVPVYHPEIGDIELAYRVSSGNSVIISYDTNLKKLNCTVAFINKHLSMTKCKRSCTTMGASHFRWFHDGCCECIGEYCINYGIEEPRCLIQSD